MFEYVIIKDIYEDMTLPSGYYSVTSKAEKDFDGEVESICEMITLFPHKTARTNVIFKNSKGQFVSYKDIGGDVQAAMELLKPFPEEV